MINHAIWKKINLIYMQQGVGVERVPKPGKTPIMAARRCPLQFFKIEVDLGLAGLTTYGAPVRSILFTKQARAYMYIKLIM